MSWVAIIGKWRRRIQRCAIVLAALLVVAWLALEVAISLVSLPEGLWQQPSGSTVYLDRNGRLLRHVRLAEGAFSRPTALADCPDHFLKAVLAAEDKRFWEHHGVDWLATARATRDFASEGRVVSGASTITQQLIKNAAPRPRTVGTKITECLQAMKLERKWSKQHILEEYLNRLDYGNLCRGPAMAASYYFDKPLSDLSAAEAAFLAALPNAPSRLNPHKHFTRARQRQQLILHRMARNGWLDEPAFQRARAEPLVLKKNGRPFEAPHFVDMIRRSESPGEQRSTIDLPLNLRAREILRRNLTALASRNVSNGAVVVIENNTGNVIALVGSRDWGDPNAGQVNGAMARRSAGSTFKPFTYCLALENGATAATVIADVPTDFPTATGLFRPHNFNRRFHGPVRLRISLANSLNVAAVKTLQLAGGPGMLLDRLRQCGLGTLEEDAEFYGLGLTIGNAEARLLELANAYACLARLGQYKPARLLDGDTGPSHQVFDTRAAWLIADMLSDNDARAQAFGLDSPLAFDFRVACKTGTSTDFRDNWAFGYTPEFTVGVWIGNFDGTPMRGVSGVSGAAPVMHAVMLHLRKEFGTTWYPRPDSIEEHTIHSVTGNKDARGIHEWFLEESPPNRFKEGHGHKIQLDSEYTEWLASPDNWLGDHAILNAAGAARARLLSPLPGTVFYIDPDLPATSRNIRLKLDCNEPVQWTSPTLECDGFHARLKPGRHQLVATVNGQRLETWIDVEEL